MTKFFKDAFATGGDKTTVPEAIQPSGSVSYIQGFSINYTYDILTNPSALAFPRQQFNQLMYDITGAIQQYQVSGVPNFITSSDNGGSPYSYSKYAFALYSGSVYQSKANSNTADPTDTTKWKLLDSLQSAVIYDSVDFEGTVVDKDAVYWDSVNSEFAKALADGTAKQNVIGIADTTNKRVYALGLVPVFTALTSGGVYYLSSSVAGAITTVVPANNIVKMGIGYSSTTLLLKPEIERIVQSSYPFAATLNADQAITGTSYVTVEFDNNSTGTAFDVGGFYDTTTFQFKPTVAGYYAFELNVHASPFASGATMTGRLIKNGTSVFAVGGSWQPTFTDTYVNCSGQIYLNGTTDYVQGQIVQSAAGTLNILSDFSRFEGARLVT